MALGADRPGILALMLMSGLQMVTAGLGIGLLFATLAFGGLNAILVGVSRFDPISLVGIPLLLIIVALAATLTPALAATRVDPMEALRHSQLTLIRDSSTKLNTCAQHLRRQTRLHCTELAAVRLFLECLIPMTLPSPSQRRRSVTSSHREARR